MRNRMILAVALLSAVVVLLTAQQKLKSTEELLELPTSVLILKDGEQLVIRGDFTVETGLVLFYLDHGRYPTYASIAADTVDFESTRAANEKLRQERKRQELYLRLLEERRRRLLEEVEERPVVIRTQDGAMSIEDEEAVIEESAIVEEFPPYQTERLANEPETWWRDESARLFTALDDSNARLATLGSRHDGLVLRINRAESEEQAAPLRQQLAEVRQTILAERERARLIGNRLTDLSIVAENLGLPLDWLLPVDSEVVDESEQPPGAQASTIAGEEGISTTYNASELTDKEDEWWRAERVRLEQLISESDTRLRSLRQRYNDVLRERNTAELEPRKEQLGRQLQALETSITEERDRLDAARSALDSLVQAARQLGKEEAIGLMIEQEGS